MNFNIEVYRYHFLPIFPIQVLLVKLSADTDSNTDTVHLSYQQVKSIWKAYIYSLYIIANTETLLLS